MALAWTDAFLNKVNSTTSKSSTSTTVPTQVKRSTRSTRYSKTPTVTANIKTNSGNVCEFWDASCKVQQGIDSISEGVVQAGLGVTTWVDEGAAWISGGATEFQDSIDTSIKNTQKEIDQGAAWVQQGFNDGVTWVQGGLDQIEEQRVENANEFNKNITTWVDEGAAWLENQPTVIEIVQDAINPVIEDTQKWYDDGTVWIQEESDKIKNNFVETITETQKGIDEFVEDGATWFQGGLDEAGKSLGDAAAATVEAMSGAAAAAGEGVTKGMTDTLKIAGIAALGIGVLLVMKK